MEASLAAFAAGFDTATTPVPTPADADADEAERTRITTTDPAALVGPGLRDLAEQVRDLPAGCAR